MGMNQERGLIMEQNGLEGHDFFTVVKVGYTYKLPASTLANTGIMSTSSLYVAGRVFAFIDQLGDGGGG